ncbi:MAG: protease, partial [Caulobacteraceae bacterium]
MPDIFEPTDPHGTINIQVGQTAQGVLSTAGEGDVYAVDLVAGQTYTFALTGSGFTNQLIDPFLFLYDFEGVALDFNDDDGPGATSTLTFTATSSGTYY